MVGYRVKSPDELYQGKSYNTWIKAYFSWYFSDDPDSHNTGPVVFLKSVPPGYPFRATDTNPSVEGELPEHMTEPNVRVGRDRIDMYQNQAILIPAIVAYFSATGPSDTIHTLQNFVRDAASNSDNPPRREQVMINTDPINVSNMRDYFFETDLFTLSVPSIPPARSYAAYVEYPPLMTGEWPTVASGYFFILTFDAPGTYIVQSRVKGKKYLDGRDYHADMYYEIVVHERTILPEPAFDFTTEMRTAVMLKKIKDKKDELTPEELEVFETLLYKPETLTRLKMFGISLEKYNKQVSDAIVLIPGTGKSAIDLFGEVKDKLSQGKISSQVCDQMKKVIKFDLLTKLESQKDKLKDTKYKELKDKIEKESN